MKISSVHLQNYGAFFGEHTFQMEDRGLCLVLGENQDEPRMSSNGSGKSTLFDALDWALFGCIPREDHADSIVNEEAAKDCFVEVRVLDDSGRVILVRRTRRSGKVTMGVALSVDGVDRTALDAGETQRLIEAELGLDRETFHAAVLFAQTDLLRFADATDSVRMEQVTRALQLGQVDEWLEKAKAGQATVAAMVARLQNELSQAEGRLAGLRSVNYEQQIAQWEAARVAQVQQQEQYAVQLQGRIAELERTVRPVEAIQASIASLQALVPAAPPELSQADAEVRELAGVIGKETAVESQAFRQVGQLQFSISQLQAKRGGTCGACGQPIAEGHVAGEVARLEAQIEALGRQRAEALERMNVAQVRQRGLQQAAAALQARLNADRQEHASRMNQLSQELVAGQRLHQELAMSRGHLEMALATAAKARSDVNPYVQKASEHALQVQALEADVAVRRAALAGAQEQLQYVEFWVEGFGSKGLKNYILDTKLQAITDAANYWVRLLTGGTIWVRIETQTMGRSTGTLRNKLNVRVFRHCPDGTIRERNYRSWSGGEKQRVSLGIDLGLASLVSARAKKHYDLLILDELFKHLDPAGEEAIVDLLQVLKRQKSSVFVVSHSFDFQAQFERRFIVRKKGGRSAIIEEADPRVSGVPSGERREDLVMLEKRKPRRTPVAQG